jgi:hypothetical protein
MTWRTVSEARGNRILERRFPSCWGTFGESALLQTFYKSTNLVVDRAIIRSFSQRRVDITPQICGHFRAGFSNDQDVILAFCVDEITSFENNIVPRHSLIRVSVISEFTV